MEIHIGCSGWFYWHWREIFYPAAKPTKDWFKHYTQSFDTVELNAPFYRWPQPATVKAWRRAAPEGFRYSIKVNQLITHEKRLVRTRQLIRDFYLIADILGPQLGCFLFQFPPSYRYTPSRLKSLIAQLDPTYRNAIEFRHRSWWRQVVFRRFQERGLVFCSISAPRFPEDLVRTSDILYLRFHGRSRWYQHNYSPEELAEWTEKSCKAAHAPRGYISITTAKALRSKMGGSYAGSCAVARQWQIVRPKAAKHVPAILPG